MSNIIHLPGNIDASQVSYDGDSISNKLDSFSNDLQEINEYLDESDEVIGESIADLDARINGVQDYLDNSLYDTFVNTSLTEAQALADGEEDVVYYASDTYSIILNGQKYSSGSSSITYPFKYANDTTNQANWDTNKIYLVKTASDGQFTMYYYNGSAWASAGTQTLQALTAANVSYDLTNVNVGTGTVQSAIENLDASTTNKTNDLFKEFIEERFPYYLNDEGYGYNIVDNVYNDLDTMTVIAYPNASSTNKYETVYTLNKVPKGTLIHYHTEHTAAYVLRISYSTSSPQEYYENNSSSLLNFVIDGGIILNQISNTKSIYDDYYIMPEDGYVMYSYFITVNGQSGLIKANTYFKYYDSKILSTIYTEFYQKSVGKGSIMASIAGLGYNIFDYITYSITTGVNLTGFKYGCDLYRQYINAASGSFASKFKNNKSIVYFPDINMTGVTSIANLFDGCTNLTTIPPNLRIPTASTVQDGALFRNCSNLVQVDGLNNKVLYNAYQMFSGCSKLKYVNCKLDTSICSSGTHSLNQMFTGCTVLQHVEEVDYKGMNINDNANVIIGANTANLRHFKAINFGQTSALTSFTAFSRLTNWGVNTTAESNARQSLIDTLLTYSYDRATAGYTTCTVKLSANTMALLTQQEKDDITAKGYTLTT